MFDSICHAVNLLKYKFMIKSYDIFKKKKNWEPVNVILTMRRIKVQCHLRLWCKMKTHTNSI